jgi:hypothetical protein
MSFETNPPHILSAAEIFAAQDIEERTVDVPQWGGAVRIRTFSKRQAAEMTKRATQKDRHTGKESVDKDILEALLFTEGIIEPKFEVADYEQLQDKSAVAISTVLKAIMDASGLSDSAVSEAGKSPTSESNGTVRISPGARARDDTGGIVATDVGL